MDNNKDKNKGKFGYFLSSLLGVLVGAGLVFGIYNVDTSTSTQISKTTQVRQEQGEGQISSQKTGTSTISVVAKKLMPAVVGITSTVNPGIYKQGESGVGSGIIVDERGYILTNNHVVSKKTDEILVSLYDGREVKGKVVWADENLDMAVVKINANKLVAAPLGDSDALSVGDTAVAIGNPLGLTFQRTVTSGIISAMNRTIGEEGGVFMEDLLQTDASINPGNSGGPLININGEVIGMNTVKVTSAEGMGFAIPINLAKPILKSIEEKGSFATPIIGIQGVDKQMAGFTTNIKVDNGIYVYESIIGGPAYKQGIRKGDVILSVNGKQTNTMISFKTELYTAGVGNTISLKVKSADGSEKDIKVKLESAKSN